MKQKKERKKWKGLKTRYLLMGIVALMIASSQTVRAEEINWQKATEIAKRYVTLPQDDGMKAKENGRKNKADIPFIYIMMRGDRDSLSYLVITYGLHIWFWYPWLSCKDSQVDSLHIAALYIM